MFSQVKPKKQPHLLRTLCMLMLLFIIAQVMLFSIHERVTELINTLIKSSILFDSSHAMVFFPVVNFVLIQLLAYGILIAWIWFITNALASLFNFSSTTTYVLGVIIFFLTCSELLLLNHAFFPSSFFSQLMDGLFSRNNVRLLLIINSGLLLFATFIAYLQCFYVKRYRFLACFFLLLVTVMVCFSMYNRYFFHPKAILSQFDKPNIIIIGLDSLRPDFTSYFGNKSIHTPTIDQFLKTSTVFTESYTPLARTFPAWISILTGKHPKTSNARNNLVDPEQVFANDTLAKELKKNGYETIYATDEKRFSNINEAYGFDRIIGPKIGVNDFILGGLSDFPLTNLLINSPIGPYLFPYNYGNRAAAITYQPNAFLQLVRMGLKNRAGKPLFLAIHLCLSHWPFTWAGSHDENLLLPDQYKRGVIGVDAQLGKLLKMLQQSGLLQHSIVVLLSDHGTSLGLRGDRIINTKNYLGDVKKIKLIPIARYSNAPEYTLDFEHDYAIDTAYGQGTDVLSLKQYHVLMAFKAFGLNVASAHHVKERSSLVDIAPTLLDMLQLPKLDEASGISLKAYLQALSVKKSISRALFMETGDSISEMETDHIDVNKVVKERIAVYQLNPKNGYLFMSPAAEKSLIGNKQLSMLYGDWLLARYPMRMQTNLTADPMTGKFKFVSIKIPPIFILVNIKTGAWTMDLQSAFAKKAPKALMAMYHRFYANDLAGKS